MASYEDKAKEFEKILDLFEKYASEGKYSSMDFRGKKQKLASLKKKMDKEDETQNKIFRNLESRYAALYELKNKSNEALAKLDKKAQRTIYIKKQELKEINDINKVYDDFAESSDIREDSIEVAKAIKGNQKEQEIAKRLIQTYVYLEKEKENILKKKNERLKKLNKELIDKIEIEKLSDKILERIITQAKMGGRGKNGSFVASNPIIANVYDFLVGGQGQGLSEGEIASRILNSQNDINLRGPMSKLKTPEENITKQYIGFSKTSFLVNTETTARRITLKDANRKNLKNFFKRNFGNMNVKNKGDGKTSSRKPPENVGQFGGYWGEFEQILVNTMEANLAKLGYPDITDPNDDLGLFYATLKQVIMSDFLPEHIQKVLGVWDYNEKGKKGRKPKIYKVLEDIEKSAAKVNNFSYIGNASNDDHLIKTGKGKTLRIHSMDDLAKYRDLLGNDIKMSDLHQFSTFHTLFPGLALNKETVNKLKTWNRIIGNSGVETNLSNSEVLFKNESLTPEELNGVINGTSYSNGKVKVSSANSKTKKSKAPTSSTVGGVSSVVSFNSGDILKAIGGVQYKLEEIIKLLSGEVSVPAIVHSKQGSATDLIDEGGEEQPREGKSAYQVNQENNSRVRTRHKSFIAMLIPELAKILHKSPVWDAIKLLLFKFGQAHPKLAATALLGGPALITGVAALVSKAFFRNTLRGVLGREVVKKGRLGNSTKYFGEFGETVSSGITNVYTKAKNGISKGIADYKYNSDFLKYMRDEVPNLKKKAKLGRLAQKAPANLFANQDKIIQEGLKAEKDLSYIRKTYFNLRRRKTLSGVIEHGWQTAYASKFGITPASNAIKTAGGMLKSGWQTAAAAKFGITPIGNALKAASAAKFGLPLMGNTLKQTADVIKASKFGMAPASVAIKSGRIITAPMEAAGKLMTPALKAMGKIGKGAKIMGPIGTAFAALAEVPDLISAAKSGKPGALKTQASKSVGGVAGSLAGAAIGSAILPVVGTAIGAIIGDIIGRIVGPAFMDGFSVLGKDFKKDFEALWDGLKDVFTGLGKVIVPIVRFVGRLMVPSFKLLGFILGGLVKTLTWSLNIIGKTLSWVGKTIGNIADAIYQGIKGMWDKMKTIPLLGPVVKKIEELYSTSADGEGDDSGDSSKGSKDSKTSDTGGKVGSTTVLTNNTSNYTKGVKASDVHKKHYGSIDGHTITSGFGYRGDIGVKGASKYHKGVDLAYRKGEAVGAKHAGKVVFAGKQSGYGNVVYVQEDNGTVQRYGHLNSIAVKKGDKVGVGTKLGGAGNTGTSGGVHLHYEVRDKNGKALDPAAYELGKKIYGAGGSSSASANPEQLAKIQQTNDDVRSSLMNLAMQTNAKNKKESVDKIVWDPTDVTGSLGCWGIVDLNNTGQMAY